MNRVSIVSFFIFIIIGAAGGAEAGESIATAHEHTAKEHVVIRIGDLGIQPESQTLAAQEAVVWINYGQVPVRITLEPGAATRVSCREPSHFEVEESGELRAPMLEAFGMASLCLLSPGEYGYTVEELDLVSRPIRVLPGGRRFSGALVVREEPSGSPRSSSISNLAFYHRTLAMTEHELARFYSMTNWRPCTKT